jgi:hypothetical protein
MGDNYFGEQCAEYLCFLIRTIECNVLNKIQNDEVSDTTGDEQRDTACFKKIITKKQFRSIIK